MQRFATAYGWLSRLNSLFGFNLSCGPILGHGLILGHGPILGYRPNFGLFWIFHGLLLYYCQRKSCHRISDFILHVATLVIFRWLWIFHSPILIRWLENFLFDYGFDCSMENSTCPRHYFEPIKMADILTSSSLADYQLSVHEKINFLRKNTFCNWIFRRCLELEHLMVSRRVLG